MSLLNGVPLDGTTIQIQMSQPLLDPISLASRLASELDIIQKPPMRLTGVESIDYTHNLSTTKPKGVGQIANSGYTPGVINIDNGTMELWVIEVADWINAYGGVIGWYNHTFDLTITYRIKGLPLQKVTLIGCRPLGCSAAASTGTSDNLTATVTFGISEIKYGVNNIGVGALGAINLANTLI